ncbi:MAG: ribosome-associated translation inhibitor RaiA [Smithellaceae bacterium]|nr:ribosome-associated translation inhibitor RaiA [Smithellaceae bacterium]
MNISITFRNSDVGNWQKEFVEEKLTKLKKYIDGPCEAHVVLSVEKFRQVAEINFLANGLNINSKEEAKEMSQAIDDAIDKVEKQLKKHRAKIRQHKQVDMAEEESAGAELGLEEQDSSLSAKIIETRKVILKPMSPEDAVLEIETLKNRFVIYRDGSTERVCVIYRLDNGKYALLETNG